MSAQRYDTTNTREHYYKYRDSYPQSPNSLYYGSDKDMFHKTYVGVRLGAAAAVGAGVFICTFENDPRYKDKADTDVRRAVERGFRHGIPWLLAGTAFGVTTSFVAHMRDKDGPLNHIIGGITAGTVFGSWYKSAKVGTYLSAIFALTAGVLKEVSVNDAWPAPSPRRARMLNQYRIGWMTERPYPEGIQDTNEDDNFKSYRP